jgi:hypothetical protein
MMRIEMKHYWLLPMAALFACPAGLPAQAKLEPVPIMLPKPGYEGTPPKFLNIPNMEKPSGKERGPFLAPAGVTNVAKGKKVTSSEKDPVVGDLDMVTDGDDAQIEGNNVELGRGVQWVTIDLTASHEIYGVLFWHYYQPRVYFSVIVQTADDEAFTKNVQTWFNNDTNNKAKQGAGKNLNYVETYEGKLVDCKGAQARYVRLYSAGNNANELNDYIEVEVFGRPAK